MKSKFVSLFILFVLSSLFNISLAQYEVYPSHWWVGMKNRSVQLMIHKDGMVSPSIATSSRGVVVKKLHQPENDHYLFVDIEIQADAKPGVYTFRFSDGSSFQYELKKRNLNSLVHKGVRSNDLIYLIMPDRFVNADTANDKFNDLEDKVAERDNPYARHGGDLKGVESKLDYLKELGVTTIWMTPVLENNMPRMKENTWMMSGYHGYWITNHYKVDKRFGGNEAYKSLVEAAHAKGLKVIQDAVYNHVGLYHHTVKDLPMRDWLNQWPSYTGPDHREEVFFDPHATATEKQKMIGGWFVPHLPDLNLANPYCAKFVIQNNIWSTEEFGIDGWRVDTYKYCDERFLNTINQELLKEFPLLSVFGEAWTNTVPGSAYFTQNNLNVTFKHQIKGVTDFPVNAAIIDAINQPFGWTEGIMKLYMTLAQDFLYKDPATNCIFLDNHDMNRFFSTTGENLEKYKMGLGILLTIRGIPQIYYGTEILMKNYKDPNDAAVRKDFPGGWKNDSVNKFQPNGRTMSEQLAFEYFKQLALFRKSSTALTSGKMTQFIPKNGMYVYFRTSPVQKIMCVVNTSTKEQQLDFNNYKELVGANSNWVDVLGQQRGSVSKTLSIPAQSFQLFEIN